MTETVDATVITYPQNLLSLARALIDESRFGIAVVVAHMACEVATERSFVEAFAARGIQYMEDAVTEFLNGYNLSNDRIRRLYTSLSGADITTEPFWPAFKQSAKRRNDIMHGSLIAGKAEAEQTLRATTELVAYLGK